MTSYEFTKYGCKDSNGYLWYVGVLSSVEPNSHPTVLSVRMLWTKCQGHAMIHRGWEKFDRLSLEAAALSPGRHLCVAGLFSDFIVAALGM